MATKTVVCPACGGGGEVWSVDLEDYDRCDNCDGTGELTEERIAEIAEGDQGKAEIQRTYYGRSAGDIAKALGVHRQTFHSWTRRDDFPGPLGEVAGARVWDLDQVRAWREQADLQPGRPKGS